MTDQPKRPFGLTPIRLVILGMGALTLVISLSIIMGGPGAYQALKEASNAAKQPTAEQISGQ